MSFDFLKSFLYSQLLVTPPLPTTNFSGQTVIITGSNTGLGLEASRHFLNLHASKIILAVRTLSKGQAAATNILASSPEKNQIADVVEVWPLELESYESVSAFVKRVGTLERLDVLVANAGVTLERFRIAGEDEATVTVNVTSTVLLALGVLPKLRETAERFGVRPRLTVVTSDLHFVTPFKERFAESIFEELNVEERAVMSGRYAVTKLLEVFVVRELADLITESSKPKITLNCITPGACYSDFAREASRIKALLFEIPKFLLARSTEVGSRTLVAGAEAGEESHGQYMADSKVAPVSSFVSSAEGEKTQKRVWAELSEKLERIQPGILQNI